MQISEIIKDSFSYPFSDKRQFGIITLVFLLLGMVVVGSFIALIYLTGINYSGLGLLIFIVSLLVFLLGSLLLGGYQLDIIKIACEQDEEMPVFNPKENIKNGLRAILLYFVFYIIAGIISSICMLFGMIFLSSGGRIGIIIVVILNIISLIIGVLISWIFSMSISRLAYHGSLDEGLKMKESYDDLRTIGLWNMLIYVIVMGIILSIIAIASLVIVVSLIETLNDVLVNCMFSMILCIIYSYFAVVSSRALGLLYSNVVFGE